MKFWTLLLLTVTFLLLGRDKQVDSFSPLLIRTTVNIQKKMSPLLPAKRHLYQSNTRIGFTSNTITGTRDDDDDDDDVDDDVNPKKLISLVLSKFPILAPLWTTLVAIYAIKHPSTTSIFGTIKVMQNALMGLMFAMGLSITPSDIARVFSNPKILVINALLCYGMVPSVALILSKVLFFTAPNPIIVGLILLSCVSGGQASNLFTLIAGGDVALSVICTLSTTLIGVFATPLLAKLLLGQSVLVDVNGVIQSVASLVLSPLVSGLCLGKILSQTKMMKVITPVLPSLGVIATLILVTGGASNIILENHQYLSTTWTSVVLPSCLLCLSTGTIAFILVDKFLSSSRILLHKEEEEEEKEDEEKVETTTRKKETTKRALVIETLSKSPTLAYVLACRHFGQPSGTVPAAAMVTLAILGALVASLWSILVPIDKVK